MTVEDRLREQFSAAVATLEPPLRRPADELADEARRRSRWFRVGMLGTGIVVTGAAAAVVGAVLSSAPIVPEIDTPDPATRAPTVPASEDPAVEDTPPPLRAVAAQDLPAPLLIQRGGELLRSVSGVETVLAALPTFPRAYPDHTGGALHSTSSGPDGATTTVARIAADGTVTTLLEARAPANVRLVGSDLVGDTPVAWIASREGEGEAQVETLLRYDLVTGETIEVARTGGIENSADTVDEDAGRVLVSWVGDGSSEEIRLLTPDGSSYDVLASDSGTADHVTNGVLVGDRAHYLRSTPTADTGSIDPGQVSLVTLDLATGAETSIEIGVVSPVSLDVLGSTALVATATFGLDGPVDETTYVVDLEAGTVRLLREGGAARFLLRRPEGT